MEKKEFIYINKQGKAKEFLKDDNIKEVEKIINNAK